MVSVISKILTTETLWVVMIIQKRGVKKLIDKHKKNTSTAGTLDSPADITLEVMAIFSPDS